MSDYEKALYESLAAKLGSKEVPGAFIAPFVQRGKALKARHARMPGFSAAKSAIESRLVDVPRAEAVGGFLESRDAQTQALMASLVRGTGTQTFQEPFDIGPSLQDIGWAIWMATHGKKGQGQGAGGGSFGVPPEYLYGNNPRSAQMPQGYW